MNKNKRKLEKVLKPLVNNPKLTNEIIVIDENKKKNKLNSSLKKTLNLFFN